VDDVGDGHPDLPEGASPRPLGGSTRAVRRQGHPPGRRGFAAMTNLASDRPKVVASTCEPAAVASLGAVRSLFASIHDADIPYCHWKSNEHLDRSMLGLTDLDILVDKGSAVIVEDVLARTGLKRFVATPMRSYPGIEDYLTVDGDTGRLVHLHLHYQLTLGEPFLKGYRLPWEPLLLSTRRMDAEHGIYIADPNLEFLLLVVRGALKLRLRNLAQGRLGGAFLAEFHWVRERVEPRRVLDLGEELLGRRIAGPLRSLLFAEPSLRLLASLRRAAEPSLCQHRTYGRTEARARAGLRECCSLLGALNRRFLGAALPARRTSPRGGLMVAILGSDGAGKSSVAKDVVRWLGQKVDVVPIYFGSGDGSSSALRLPLKLGLKLIRGAARPRSAPGTREGQGLGRIPPDRLDRGWWRALASALWALTLSYEKRRKLRRAIRARNLGMIVVCDRLPQNQTMGFNDGPLLGRWSDHRVRLLRALARWEAAAYERCSACPPDLVIKLEVSPEVAVGRKPEMSLWEVRRRIEAVKQLRFPPAVEVVEVDADAPFGEVCLAVRHALWRAI
jgi:hypothetical protein